MSEPLIFGQGPVEVRYRTPMGDEKTLLLAPLTLGDLGAFQRWRREHPDADGTEQVTELLRLSANWLQPNITAAEVGGIPAGLVLMQKHFGETFRALGIDMGGGPGNVPAAAASAANTEDASSEISSSPSSTEQDGTSIPSAG